MSYNATQGRLLKRIRPFCFYETPAVSYYVSIPTKIFASLLGLATALYGAALLWVTSTGAGNPLSQKLCAAWLCPEEFSRERVFDLNQQIAAGNSAHVISELKRALTLDPASPYRWADLGQALSTSQNFAANLSQAKYCFEKAVERGPHKPDILLRAANFYFATGDPAATMRNLSVILADPGLAGYYPEIFLTYSRLGSPVSKVLQAGLPANAPAAHSYLRFLIEGNQLADAEKVWNWITPRHLQDAPLTGEYLNFLLRHNAAEQAENTWLRLTGSPVYRRTNWIFNGSFENSLQPAPFDWQIDPVPSVQVRRTTSAAESGAFALELTFSGKENLDYRHAYQLAFLNPGRWKLTAFLRTQDITTDKGIGLRVSSDGLTAETDPLKGTHNWTQVATTFNVRPPAKTVRVEVMRQPSLKFDNSISGTAWLDSVSLTPVR